MSRAASTVPRWPTIAADRCSQPWAKCVLMSTSPCSSAGVVRRPVVGEQRVEVLVGQAAHRVAGTDAARVEADDVVGRPQPLAERAALRARAY